MRVRPAEPDDLSFLVDANAALARETEGRVLDGDVLRRGVSRVLRDPSRGRYFVAVDATGARLGALMVTPEWSDWRDAWFLWIQSVFVHPAARGRGVYRLLHEHVEQLARAEGAAGLRLYVDAHNAGAQAVYERVGMERAAYEMYEVDFVLRRRGADTGH